MSENDTSSYERKMAQINSQVVFFKNVDEEDFIHTYDGVPFKILAGETIPLQYPIAMLFAKHLAMKILRRKKAKAGIVGRDDKTGKPVNLYPENEIQELQTKIIVKTVDRPLPERVSPGEKAKREQAELQQTFKDQLPKNTEVQKKDVIKELNRRKVKFDPRASKEDLLAKLIESEKAGGDEEDEK